MASGKSGPNDSDKADWPLIVPLGEEEYGVGDAIGAGLNEKYLA